jgi:ABC-type bacteriocin/lantibiotic exporter with double-glycine peptidase domain
MVSHAIVHKAQQKNYNCGPTCLEMLFDFYEIPHVAEELEALCETSEKHGTHHANLVKAAQSLGAHVEEKENATLSDIAEVLASGHPVLVNYFNPLTKVGHFAIIKGIDEGSVIMADPKNGDNYRLSFDEFDSYWHNHNKTLFRWMMHLV